MAEPDDRLRKTARRFREWDNSRSADTPGGFERSTRELTEPFEASAQRPVRMGMVGALFQKSTGASKLYSVPRRFDLATLFVVTTAYAILFTSLRLLDYGPLVMLFVGTFVTIVGAGQALLFGGNVPRASSIITGAAFTSICWTAVWSVYPYGGPLVAIVVAINGCLVGGVVGYLVGVLVAGVFLMADVLRQRYGREERRPEPAILSRPETAGTASSQPIGETYHE